MNRLKEKNDKAVAEYTCYSCRRGDGTILQPSRWGINSYTTQRRWWRRGRDSYDSISMRRRMYLLFCRAQRAVRARAARDRRTGMA